MIKKDQITAVGLFCLLALSMVGFVSGFSTGAPVEACETLSPFPLAHTADPQNTSVPYEVDLSAFVNESGALSYVPGESYTLMVRSISGEEIFRGFFLQGRLENTTTPVGSFVVTDSNTRLSDCLPPNISLTHDNSLVKDFILTNWTAPPEGTGPITIGFAVVMEMVIYWADQRTVVIAERATIVTTMSPTTMSPTTMDPTTMAPTSMGPFTTGGDPHFSIMLPSKQQLCYSVQGEQGFIFNLISNKMVQINAMFVADSQREEVTWIGKLGVVVQNARYKNENVTTLQFDATKRTVLIANDITLNAQKVDKLTFRDGKLVISEAVRGFNCSCYPIQVELQDIGLNFSVHFVKNNHIDMKWDGVSYQLENSHGLIGQFFRKGIDIDESRHLLLLPDMDPVPIMRKPIWHFMERENPEDKMCWVAMNPGYQGKRLIQGHYLDYVMDNLLSTQFKM